MLGSSTDNFVKSFTHLKTKPHADRALSLLRKIASVVKPIMRKHGWVLPVLSEFFPTDDNLLGLNVNMGKKIILRLRPHYAPDTFYDEEQLVLVMLHELTHNVRGPHDDVFDKHLAGLEEEYYELKRTGYAGEGFFSPGHRLGGGGGRNAPLGAARVKALTAADKRRSVNRTLGDGGRLGGGLGLGNKTMRELAAEGAQRRLRDHQSCNNLSKADAEREEKKAEEQSIKVDVIDLTDDPPSPSSFDRDGDDSDDEVIIVEEPVRPKRKANSVKHAGSNSASSASSSSSSKAPLAERPPRSSSRHHPYKPTRPAPSPKLSSIPQPPDVTTADWACPSCTFLNRALALQCSVCLATRSQKTISQGWICVSCGESGITHDFWSCTTCGAIKVTS